MNTRFIGFGFALSLVAMLSACDKAPPTTKEIQAQHAADEANSITFTSNAEIENIKKRLQLTSQTGLLGYIILLNEAGQPILYEGVVGKVTSGSKRLTDPKMEKMYNCASCTGTTTVVTDAPSDEGTYGSSAEYIYYWNVDGAYRQWNGKYLYSDKPFRLSIQPLVIGTMPPNPPVPPTPVTTPNK